MGEIKYIKWKVVTWYTDLNGMENYVSIWERRDTETYESLLPQIRKIALEGFVLHGAESGTSVYIPPHRIYKISARKLQDD